MRLRRLIRWMVRLVLLATALLAIAVTAFWFHCSGAKQQPRESTPDERARLKITKEIKNYARPEEDTFLTYPEWYIVWSYQEKADYQQHSLPSGFAYFGAIGQYWSGYCCVNRYVRGRYPFNFGDHLMLFVIGSSFSGEYALKGAYEKTLGRISEWLSSHQMVDEDQYAYRVARDYADFVHVRPFYEFHFAHALGGLWAETKLWGPHPARKWERKFFLSLDYAIEAAYCWVIEKASHAVYGIEDIETDAWVDNTGEDLFRSEPQVRKVKQVGPKAYIVAIPRYQEFTEVAMRLAARNVQFVEIAGNDVALVSLTAPQEWKGGPGEMLSSPILTQPGRKRVLLQMPIAALTPTINDVVTHGAQLEHVYDY